MYLPTGFTIGNHLLYNYFMPDTILTKEMLARSRVIAKGRAIREVERLVRLYGGKVSLWLKKSSPPLEMEGRIYEFHWYEQHGIGRFEVKIKEVKDS
jgi:hypothetical protein